MPIISRFPKLPPAKWVLEATTYDSRQTVSTLRDNGNVYIADVVLWNQKTGLLLRDGDGITITTKSNFYQNWSKYLNTWIWFDSEKFGETAYRVDEVTGAKLSMVIWFYEKATVATK